MTIRKSLALVFIVAAVGFLTWRLWPDGASSRRHQRGLALIHALGTNDLVAATRLLDEGADPNAQLPTLSFTQKAEKYYLRVSRGMKSPTWNQDDEFNPRWSALEVAVVFDDVDMVGPLLAKGADAKYRDKIGNTALVWAKRLKMVERPGTQKSRDYSRMILLLEAADAPPNSLGNKP